MLTKKIFTESSFGEGINVGTASTPPNIQEIHTAVSEPSIDEVWLWAVNTTNASQTVTIVFGDATESKNRIVQTLEPGEGPVTIVPGWPLSGGKKVFAFAGNANAVNIFGYVNEFRP